MAPATSIYNSTPAAPGAGPAPALDPGAPTPSTPTAGRGELGGPDAGFPEREQILRWLRGEESGGDGRLFARAREVMRRHVDNDVRLRGLLEFSNRCACNCSYCGIRRAVDLDRYTLSLDEVIEVAMSCLENRFGSITLQAGERRDPQFVSSVEEIVTKIKRETRTAELPEGLGITLCVGEQSHDTYQRWFDAGAHRYLLRIETSSPRLFAALHPRGQSLRSRIDALRDLKSIGYQLGTGVMIGVPGQTLDDLAADVAFFRDIDADMIGMGPFIPSVRALRRYRRATMTAADRLVLSLRMIAVTRIALRDVNIAATTALQALSPTGREAGLAAGANVLMPIMTPVSRRSNYQLYDGKPCVDEDSSACAACMPRRAMRAARNTKWNAWGDAPHAST